MTATMNTLKSSNCWMNELGGLSKVKNEEYFRYTIISKMLYRQQRVYFDNLSESFSRWRKWNHNLGFLSKGTRIQVNLPGLSKDKEWVWGEVCNYDGTYSVMFDILPGKIYEGIPRNLIKPLTRLVRSGAIIDWNDIEPPQKQRMLEKCGRGSKRSDFEEDEEWSDVELENGCFDDEEDLAFDD